MHLQDYPIHIFNGKELLHLIEGVNGGFRSQHTAILFVRKGTISFEINGEKRIYTEQQFLFISNRNAYENPVVSEDIDLYLFLNNRNFKRAPIFKFNQFELFKMIAVEVKNAVTIPENDQAFIWSHLDNIHHVYNNRTGHVYTIDVLMHLQAALIYSLIGILHQTASRKPISFNNRKEILTSKFTELCFEHHIQERSLQFYADKLNVSVKYLSICVKDVTGHPPTYIINQLLMYEARIKLADKELTIAQISDVLQFSDQFVFSKFFKNNMGISPKDFRKKAFENVTI